MRVEQAAKHFGNRHKLAKFLEIQPSAVYQWGDLVPYLRACELQARTGGALKVDFKDYEKPQQ